MRIEANGATMKMKKRLFLIAAAAALSVLALSCASLPAPVPEGATAAEIIQRAQDRSDIYDWKGAQFYYGVILERFSNDLELVASAKYELAFIEYKQGRYSEAAKGFEEVLAMYEGPQGAQLSARWRILSEKLLAKIKAKGR